MQALPTVVAALALSICARAQVLAYHDQTLAQHQAQITSLRNQGYRMIAVTSYETAATPWFAAVWQRQTGPTQVPFSSVDGATWQSLFNTWSAAGHRPTLLAVHGSGTSTRFTGVFEPDTTPYWAAHDLTSGQFDDQCVLAQEQGYLPTAVAVYGTSLAPRFAGVWTRNTAGVDWSWTHSTTPSSYQLHFDAMTDGWLRPGLTAVSSYGRYLSIWHDSQLQNGWGAAHDMTSAGYQAQVTAQSNAGRYPIVVTAAGAGAATRFAAVFASSRNVVARQWSATGNAVLGLGAFDTWVQNLMQANHVRAGALAIVRDGRLMHTRGYTWAEPGYPQTQPTSLFRIASMTKPLTSIAIHRAFSRNAILHNYPRRMLSYFPPIQPFDPDTSNITLLNLLTHAGGWNIAALHFDPQFHDVEIADWANSTVPITRDEIFRFMTLTRDLNFTPGTASIYSNYGYNLLGRVLENINPGMTYEQIVQRDIFAPLGVTRARIGGSSLAAAAAGEVRYHAAHPYIAQSVANVFRPWVPGPYGSWNQANMDSHGGWIMAAADFAAVLASFALGDDSPVLDNSWTTAMWTTTTGLPSNVLRGWFRTPGASFRVLRHHNGGLPGTATCGVLRSDGVGFVLFLNRDISLGDTEYLQLDQLANSVTQWPDHDLFPSLGIPGLRTHTTGTFTAYGAGCSGSSGTPNHTGVGTAELGYTMTLRTTNGPTNGLALLLLGTSRTSWQGTLLPYALAIHGAPGCSVLAAPAAVHTQTLNTFGIGNTDFAIPINPALIGIHVYSQSAPFDPAANTLGLVFSNGIDTRIGGWR